LIGPMIFENFVDQVWIGFNFIRQDWTRTGKFRSPLISGAHVWFRTTEVSMDRIRIGYPAGYWRFCLKQDWNWIIIFEENWIRTGSGYLFV